MKVIAGVVLAGALAGTIGLMGPIGPMNSPPPAAKGPIVKEYFAFVSQHGQLDGPRREALSGRDSRPAFDEKGNIYFFNAFAWGAIRCIRADGQIVTVTGNDYFTSDLKLSEGPASAFGNPTGVRGFSYGTPSGWMAVVGIPDEGEDKGCIYVSDPHAGVARIFRNKAKGNRWWFEKIIGGGKAKPPTKRGGTVGAKDVGLGYLRGLQLNKDKKLCIIGDGSFLEYENGKLTCLLGPEDYAICAKDQSGRVAAPSEGFIGGDGSFYLSYYYTGAKTEASFWRASPDGTKIEPYAKSQSNTVRGGDALKEAGWFCGPHLCPNRNNVFYQPPDVIFTSSHDEDTMRRIMNGRAAFLCADGEWREVPARATPVVHAGNQWYTGPNGTAVQTYSGGDFDSCSRMWLFKGIDWGKPTAGAGK